MKYSLLSLILLIAAFIFSYKISSVPFISAHEARYPEAAREMIETGNYFIPQMNYEPIFDKGIFYYWQEILSLKVFGLNEFAARFPSVVFGLALIVLAFLLGEVRSYGLISALIMASSLQVIIFSKLSSPDISFSFFTAASLVFFYLGYHKRSKLKRKYAFKKKKSSSWFIASMAMTGIAFLISGPLAFLIPVLVISTFLWFQKDTKEFFLDTKKDLLIGLIILLLVNLPWYLFVHFHTDGDFTKNFFLTHNLYTFTSVYSTPLGSNWWYYIIVIALGFFPWSAFLLQSFYKILNSNEAPSKSQEEGYSHMNLFCFLWVFISFFFFTFIQNKNAAFMLPIYIPLTFIVSNWWSDKFKIIKTSPLKNIDLLLSTLFITLMSIIALYLSLTTFREYLLELDSKAFFLAVLLIGFFLISFTIISTTASFKKPKIALIFLSTACFISYAIVNHSMYPAYAKHLDDGLKKALLSIPDSARVISYKHTSGSFAFYSKRKVTQVNDDEILNYIEATSKVKDPDSYIIAKLDDYMDLKKLYKKNSPENELPFEEIKLGDRYIVSKIIFSPTNNEEPVLNQDKEIDKQPLLVSSDKSLNSPKEVPPPSDLGAVSSEILEQAI
jgi:4-amino-4-deoxy-L-arabinose transferase-like glycosyltransferase